MSETLLAEDRQRCRDAVWHTFDVDVDHLLPILDVQVVERPGQLHPFVRRIYFRCPLFLPKPFTAQVFVNE